MAPVWALPRDERELFIAASNGHVLAFDNLSGLPHWLSDTLCASRNSPWRRRYWQGRPQYARDLRRNPSRRCAQP